MAKTLTALRKEIDLTDAANVRAILNMFTKICEQNPQAVKDSFNTYMRSKSDDMQTTLVDFYHNQAEYLKELFDLS